MKKTIGSSIDRFIPSDEGGDERMTELTQCKCTKCGYNVRAVCVCFEEEIQLDENGKCVKFEPCE
jgi:hypothetical protein